uniref:Uncharacterized protein n=2 Tax=Cyprinus carpio TaxID=7962 RepID=A0A8C1RS87_CYPCA
MMILTQWWVLREALHTHGLARDHKNNGSISRFESLGVVLKLLARTTVDLLLELSKLAGNVSSVAVQHWGIALRDLTRVVQDDLSCEVCSLYRGVVLAVSSHITTADVLDRHILNVEANIVTGESLGKGLMVHLHRLDLSGHVGRGKGHNHTSLQSSSLNTSNRHSSNTYTSCRGKRRGLSVGRLGGRMESRASRRVTPLAPPSFLSIFHPLNQLIYYP